MADTIVPVILCGGAGTRLWPSSRESRPKQFTRLIGPNSTFQDTMLRVADAALFAKPVVVTNGAYRFLVAEQLAEIGIEADIVLEPVRRDSGPAIACAAHFALSRERDPIVLTLAADHAIDDAGAFRAACKRAADLATAGHIVTFGVKPGRAATEYGYIKPGKPIGEGTFAVEKFVEKPDAATAARYVADGYFWNSGNFVFRARAFLDEYARHDAQTVSACADAVAQAKRDLGFLTLDAAALGRANAKSVDYAVMEKTAKAAVVAVGYFWSDIGSWQAVWELSDKDASGNALRGQGVFVAAKNSYVVSEKALVSLFGVDDLVVIANEDAILVASRDSTTSMRQLVDQLKTVAPGVTESHLRVHRPWGSYQSLDMGERHHVKRITVKPGQRLSLQYHNRRSEHWVVVRGIAKVTVGTEVKTLKENESVYIPCGAHHRLENPGKTDLDLIEVQTGTYFGEDDIVRVEDDYKRE